MSRVVSFHYTLTGPQGEKLDSSVGREPLTFMQGAGQIFPGLEKELQKLGNREKKHIAVAARDAYGLRDDKFVIKVPRANLPPDAKPGDEFKAEDDEHGFPMKVVHVTDTEVTLDANHPLAGMDLMFDVEITAIREATADEIAHGHAHGVHGHGHAH